MGYYVRKSILNRSDMAMAIFEKMRMEYPYLIGTQPQPKILEISKEELKSQEEKIQIKEEKIYSPKKEPEENKTVVKAFETKLQGASLKNEKMVYFLVFNQLLFLEL